MRDLVIWLAAACVCSVVSGQAPNEFDFDPAWQSLTTITPNGSTHVITGLTTYTGQNLELNAPLTIAPGGELRLVRCCLRVRGDVLLQDGARLTVIDGSFLLPNPQQQQNEIRMEGGLLHTERATIGSDYIGANLAQTRLLHLRGTWLARHTVVQALVTILANGRAGWFGNALHKGGNIVGSGVFEGDRADAIHLCGMGDVTLADGTMNVAFYYDAGTPTAAAGATIDLGSEAPQTVVYGDPTVHAGVTSPLPSHPCRLELRNHRSPTWQFFAVDANQSGPLQTLTLRNAKDIICNVRGSGFVGQPVLGGPWASHFATLPGLPSTEKPGFHAMPPACSVRIGNVQFQSGPSPTDWNRIRSWGLYIRGASSDFTVNGPAMFAELQMNDGRLTLAGAGSYDLGVFANTVRLYDNSILQLRNVRLGEFGVYAGVVGLIEANGNSTCTIDGARTGRVVLSVTSPTAAISAQRIVEVGNLQLQNPGGGALNVVQATPTQTFDGQNLGFEAAMPASGVPAFWAGAGGSGSNVNNPAPGAAGSSALQWNAATAGSSVGKQWLLPAETSVAALAAANAVVAAPGALPLLRVLHQGAGGSDAIVGNTVGWQRLYVPPVAITNALAPVAIDLVHPSAPATTRFDDVRIVLGSWWSDDNFDNLQFEAPLRNLQTSSSGVPDAWEAFQLQCAADAAVVRPGAAAGSRSLRVVGTATVGNVFKQLTFLRAGDQVVVSGWARGTGGVGSSMEVIVGNGQNFYVVAPPNVFSGPLPANGIWQQFTLNYTVPNNPSFTRVDLGCFGPPGSTFWLDDLTVEVR
jgi:hypothetical protein